MIVPTAAELAAQLIRFDTSGAPGEECACLAWVRGLAEEAGLPCVVRARDARVPNAVFRLPGRGAAPPLVLHGHLDVVASGGGWEHPPFGGEVHDGTLWGRGAIDMKGAVAMMLAAVLRLRCEGFRPAGDILLVLVGDEERGGALGMGFLVDEHPQLFAGARFALGEFGGIGIESGGHRIYPIQVAERRLCAIRATVSAAGGHGAVAAAPGAVSRLARLLDALTDVRPAISLTPIAREILARAATCAPSSLAEELRALLAAEHPRPADLGIADGIFAPTIGSSAEPTVVRAGERRNVKPRAATVTLDTRLAPGVAVEEIVAALRRQCGGEVEFEVEAEPEPSSPLDWGLFDQLCGALRGADAGGWPLPYAMPAATDGRHLARIGITHYGFTPLGSGDTRRYALLAHAVDERVPVAALEWGSAALEDFVRRYRDPAPSQQPT